ncbi:MAG: hypothetical protein ABIA21_02235 [Candidatus Aenigmatarchaeota archaeon]
MMDNEISVTEAYLAFKPFINRDDSFAVMKDGVNEYCVVKDFLFPKYFKDHLDGKNTIGLFQISKDNKIKWLCWDFDAAENQPLDEVFEDAKKLYSHLKSTGYNPILEFSGRRGYHVWLFVNDIDAGEGKAFAEKMASESNSFPHEIFPKQSTLSGKGFGCMVKLPLGIHKVSGKRSFLLDGAFNEMDMKKSINLMKSIQARSINGERYENEKTY